MAGTNTSIKVENIPLAPVIILVGPQLGENIGMCARAMLNCAVTELRIVNPRDGWPNPAAVASASGAIDVIENAKLYTSTADAVADLEFVLATTARGRGLVKDIYTAQAAAKIIRRINGTDEGPHPSRHGGPLPSPASGRGTEGEGLSPPGQKCGILFGPERTGLENDDIALANAILNIPLNPGFSSLNLAQAVLLTCHAWLTEDNPFEEAPATQHLGDTAPAKKDEIENLLRHMEEELEDSNFFRSADQRPTLMRNIRNFFFRAAPTQQDVRTLHGIVKCLSGKKNGNND